MTVNAVKISDRILKKLQGSKFYFNYIHENFILMNIPAGLKYTEDHEWVRVEGSEAIIGVTDFAQSELGDIVYVEVETLDETLAQGDVFGTIEAVKAVSDLFIPLAGEVVAFNEDLEENPQAVNNDPYGAGWMVRVKFSDAGELDNLLSAEKYKELVG